jgi:hypothetical protein
VAGPPVTAARTELPALDDLGAREAFWRVTYGLCVCCGARTDDWVPIGEGVKMCREWCIDPDTGRDHRDVTGILLEAVLRGAQLAGKP